MQHLGNNLLPTVRELASSPYLVDAVHYKDKTAIFWDLAGIVLIVFPDAAVARVWYCILLGAVLAQRMFDYARQRTQQHDTTLGLLGLSQAFGWKCWVVFACQCCVFLGGVVFSLLVGSMFIVTGRSMAWFSSLHGTWMLYGMSSLTGTLLSRWCVVQCLSTPIDALAASTSLWWVLLCVAVYFNVQSAYVPAVPLFFQLLGTLLQMKSIVPAVVGSIVVQGIPCMLLAQYYCTVGTFFVPITGRIGDWIPSDLLVALLLGVVGSLMWTIPTASLHVSSSSKFSKSATPQQQMPPSLMKKCLGCCSVLTGVVLLYLLHQTPYSEERPKRLYVQQTSRTVHGLMTTAHATPRVVSHDQGLWVNAFDKRGLEMDATAFNGIQELTVGRKHVQCESEKVYCGWPWYFPVQEMLQHVSLTVVSTLNHKCA